VTSPRNRTSRHTRAGSSGQDVQACRAWVILVMRTILLCKIQLHSLHSGREQRSEYYYCCHKTLIC
jgi:hypothetical protein